MNNIKKILMISIIFTMLVVTVNIAMASGVEEFYLKTTTEEKGSAYIDVAINVNKADGIGSMNLNLQFDPKVIVAEKVTLGKIASGTMFASKIKNDTGMVSLGFATTKGFSGNGPISSVRFKVVGKNGDKTALTMSISTLTDIDVKPMKDPKITNSEFVVGSDVEVQKAEKEAPAQVVDTAPAKKPEDDTKNGKSAPGFGATIAIGTLSMIYLLRKCGR
jgi:Cohesin domain